MLSKVESLVRGVGLGNFILNVLYDVEKYLVTVSYSEQGTRGLWSFMTGPEQLILLCEDLLRLDFPFEILFSFYLLYMEIFRGLI